jgi:uncharacterized protein YeaO (DUF488 family)
VIRTKRWNDPVDEDDGYRLLVTRYRPRGVPKDGEPWDAWLPQLGPSKDLHAAAYGKDQPMIDWETYRARYLREMEAQGFWIRSFAERVRRGETITLLCSSACEDPARCHRSLLRVLLETAAVPPPPAEPAGGVVRRRRV